MSVRDGLPARRGPSAAGATLAVVLVSDKSFGAALTELVREIEDVDATPLAA
jgi:hypothetical protein